MPERKAWTEEEDRILRFLREERGERKWARISRAMEEEFGAGGRSGKQCRERYHNHLDASIVGGEWKAGEEELLFAMHEEVGNKWSAIAQKLPGRSDNCVKNHFYSRLRKALRRLARLAEEAFPQEFRPLKMSHLSRIVETADSRFKLNSPIDEEQADFCTSIKSRLFRLELPEGQTIGEEELAEARQLLEDMESFERESRRNGTGRKRAEESEYRSYLKPPAARLRRQSSSNSGSSDDGSSFLSSSSLISSCSDLSEYDRPATKSTGSHAAISPPVSQKPLVHFSNLEKEEEERQWLGLDNEALPGEYHYNNMFDETPMMIARILGPAMEEEPGQLFPPPSDEEDIEFRGEP